jgi:hypothetical protein
MAAQTVKEVTIAQARAFVAGGKEIAPGVYGLPSRGVTVTVKRSTKPGYAKLIIMQGCTC